MRYSKRNFGEYYKFLFESYSFERINEYIENQSKAYERLINIKLISDFSPEKEDTYLFLKTQLSTVNFRESNVARYPSIYKLISQYHKSDKRIFKVLNYNYRDEFLNFILRKDIIKRDDLMDFKTEVPLSETYYSFIISVDTANRIFKKERHYKYIYKKEIQYVNEDIEYIGISTRDEKDDQIKVVENAEYDIPNFVPRKMVPKEVDVPYVIIYIEKESYDYIYISKIYTFLYFITLRWYKSILIRFLKNANVFNIDVVEKLSEDYIIKDEKCRCGTYFKRKDVIPDVKSNSKLKKTNQDYKPSSNNDIIEKEKIFDKIKTVLIPKYIEVSQYEDLKTLMSSNIIKSKIVWHGSEIEIICFIEESIKKGYIKIPNNFDAYNIIENYFKPLKKGRIKKDCYTRKQLNTVKSKHVALNNIPNFFNS